MPDKERPPKELVNRPQLEIDPAHLKAGIVGLASEGHLSGDLATALLDFLALRDE